jgi:hypothetical protein
MGWRIWISTRWGHTSFIIFIHSSNTYHIWNKPFFWRKYQCHQSRQLVVFYVPDNKKHYQSDISFTYLLKKCGRYCQVNTIRLFSFHLIFWHCSYHCTFFLWCLLNRRDDRCWFFQTNCTVVFLVGEKWSVWQVTIWLLPEIVILFHKNSSLGFV